MPPRLDRDLIIQAVLIAVWKRASAEAVILHSNRETQYTSQEFQEFLKVHGMVSSMSGVGTCYDNAVAESGLLKREQVHRRQDQTRAEARADIFEYMEGFYNRHRWHSFTQGVVPRIFVERYHQKSSLTCP